MAARDENGNESREHALASGRFAIRKRVGVTETELELGQLASRTFLSLWSYPGVYRSQHANQSGDGKELCDLLVVFGQHILIFSDKEIGFQHDKPVSVAWPRWFKKAIGKSAAQIFGAERWLQEHPDRVYLDATCTQPFPVPIPRKEEMRVHRMVVARGASTAIKKFFGSERGSLMLNSGLKGEAEHLSATPFTTGQIDPDRGFVHVLDDETLQIVLSTLDTIQDLVDYLDRKERQFTSDRVVMAAGEEDLLAYYLKDVGPDGKNDFAFPEDFSGALIEEGFWESFRQHPQRKAQLKEDEISYAWDILIERFAEHALNDTQYKSSGFAHPMESEEALRFLAAESRTRRRMLARGFLDLVPRVSQDEAWKVRLCQPSEPGNPLYVFMVSRRPKGLPYADFREARLQALQDYMQCAKLVVPAAENVVGIAIGHPESDDNSEDLAFLDCSNWDEGDLERAREIQESTGYLKRLNRFEGVEKTYPDLPQSASARTRSVMKGRDRNKPCPCGSGLKYKKCCGRPGL